MPFAEICFLHPCQATISSRARSRLQQKKIWIWLKQNLVEPQNCPGDGSKQDSSRQLSGIRFKEGGFMPCDDDEDLCDIGSGNGELGGAGGEGGHSVFIPNQSDSK